jgi:general secretion pathway protein J
MTSRQLQCIQHPNDTAAAQRREQPAGEERTGERPLCKCRYMRIDQGFLTKYDGCTAVAQRSYDRGFTLIELLLAMTIIAFMMVMIFGGLRSTMKAADTGEKLIDRTNRVRITQEFLRHQWQRILPMPYKQDSGKGVMVVFEGDAKKMTFVGPMPGYLTHGGSYLQTLELKRSGTELALILNAQILNGFDAENSSANKQEIEPVVLLEGIQSGEFAYQGLDKENKVTAFAGKWEDGTTTPVSVRLKLRMTAQSGLVWPDIVAPVMVDAGAVRPYFSNRLPAPPKPLPGG